MNLQLVSTKVTQLNLTKIIDYDDDKELSFKFANAYSKESPNTFQVIFEMSLSIEGNVKLDIKYVALFEGDDEFDEEFQQSAFPRVNAPAIAYPFLRAFIGTFLLNGGYEPIMLPSVNFSALYKSEK
ncbi:protein-export chaperone SecB [Vibrio vulnificus]|uniref:protein-export chaperone SecB n=1 Tax=Vibrio vulnificus TaxID=672 RepID=UPI0013028BE6|nr:protein-export chaperone SecB [Vibrio vulnificus]MCU8487983.1 protein-export chaperone SecB [Vibrio vulnificus]HAS8235715.1 preprotein translocase subunit SecB [Vibrio vulnificus]